MLAANVASGNYLGRFAFVVDDDVDCTDMFDVLCTQRAAIRSRISTTSATRRVRRSTSMLVAARRPIASPARGDRAPSRLLDRPDVPESRARDTRTAGRARAKFAAVLKEWMQRSTFGGRGRRRAGRRRAARGTDGGRPYDGNAVDFRQLPLTRDHAHVQSAGPQRQHAELPRRHRSRASVGWKSYRRRAGVVERPAQSRNGQSRRDWLLRRFQPSGLPLWIVQPATKSWRDMKGEVDRRIHVRFADRLDHATTCRAR